MNIATGKKEIMEAIEKLNEATKLANEALASLEKSEKVTGEQELSNSNVIAMENSIPPEYDVKAGDVVEITKYCTGNKIGDVVRVIEVFNTLSPSSGDKYNNVKVVNQEGVEFYEGDVKLCSSHTKKFK